MESARCWELSATVLFQAGDHEAALQQMGKTLAVYWQVGGWVGGCLSDDDGSRV
jgi:hypothetical protein